jgi:uncharacterized protein (UPF0335 family)
MKYQDFLSEDLPISGQNFALITIVGPHMNQKCDVWGMKVKGIADTLERAKSLSARLVKADPEFDIFIVEVAKFFPLVVEPGEVQDIEYQDERLNELVKSYLQNRQFANDKYAERKNDLMQAAIKEGRIKEELLIKEEHPVVVLQRIDSFKEKLEKLQDEINTIQDDIKVNTQKYDKYTDVQKHEAKLTIEGNVVETQLTSTIENVNKLIEELQELDSDIAISNNKLNATNVEHSPNMFKKLTDQVEEMQLRKAVLKEKLSNKDLVNKYINNNYENSEFDKLENNVTLQSNDSVNTL